MTIFYGNVTNFSKKAEEHLSRLKVDAWMAGETHLRGDALVGCARRLEKGWMGSYRGARPTVQPISRRHLGRSDVCNWSGDCSAEAPRG